MSVADKYDEVMKEFTVLSAGIPNPDHYHFQFLVRKICELSIELKELKQDIKFTRDSSIKNLSG